MPYFEFLETYSDFFISGTWISIQIYLGSVVVGTVFALVSALLRLSPYKSVRTIAAAYIEVFRGVSIVVQLFWIFYALPLFGLQLEKYFTGILVLGLTMGAYGAEIVRGGIQSVPRGQSEASVALNLSARTRMQRIILPQAVLIMLPSWGNLMVEMFKYSSLVSMIAIWDLMFRVKQINLDTFGSVAIQSFGTAMIIYYLLSRLVISPGMRWFEKAWARKIGMVR